MAKHRVRHDFETDDPTIAWFGLYLEDGKVVKIEGGMAERRESHEYTPAELLDLAATLQKAASFMVDVGFREAPDE